MRCETKQICLLMQEIFNAKRYIQKANKSRVNLIKKIKKLQIFFIKLTIFRKIFIFAPIKTGKKFSELNNVIVFKKNQYCCLNILNYPI